MTAAMRAGQRRLPCITQAPRTLGVLRGEAQGHRQQAFRGHRVLPGQLPFDEADEGHRRGRGGQRGYGAPRGLRVGR